MLVGQVPQNRVKFISYDGAYPNLCRGKLILEIDGVRYTFLPWGYDGKTTFRSFWCSGGGLTSDYNTYDGEWKIAVNDLPEHLREYAAEIDEVFNTNVDFGCCGGCI